MIPAKEFDGELWIRASDHHQVIKNAQRQWVGLTDEETAECFEAKNISDRLKADAKRIEAKLKQNNGYAEEKNI